MKQNHKGYSSSEASANAANPVPNRPKFPAMAMGACKAKNAYSTVFDIPGKSLLARGA